MSVREQTAVLKARLDTVSFGSAHGELYKMRCRIDDLESNCSVSDHQELLSLCERVLALEAAQGRTHFEGDDCPGGHHPERVVSEWRLDKLAKRVSKVEKALYNCDPEVLKEPITAKDVDRWRRIEEAARASVKRFEGWDVGDVSHETLALITALKP